MKGLFFFESVGVPGGSPELEKGNSGWVPSLILSNLLAVFHWYINSYTNNIKRQQEAKIRLPKRLLLNKTKNVYGQ